MLHTFGVDWDYIYTAEEEAAWKIAAPKDFAIYGSKTELARDQSGQFLQGRVSQVRHFFNEANQELLSRGKEELASLSGVDRRAALLRYARKTLNVDMETQLKLLIEEYRVED